MNLRPIQRNEEPEINLISLIDVLLVLVLFLVLTTTFAREARLSVQLPQAAVEPRPLPLNPLEVVVDAQGRWYVAEREVIGTHRRGAAARHRADRRRGPRPAVDHPRRRQGAAPVGGDGDGGRRPARLREPRDPHGQGRTMTPPAGC